MVPDTDPYKTVRYVKKFYRDSGVKVYNEENRGAEIVATEIAYRDPSDACVLCNQEDAIMQVHHVMGQRLAPPRGLGRDCMACLPGKADQRTPMRILRRRGTL